jgi:hypothetical protein
MFNTDPGAVMNTRSIINSFSMDRLYQWFGFDNAFELLEIKRANQMVADVTKMREQMKGGTS